MPEEAVVRMTPIALPERIEIIDILRGSALFGILAANMRAFNSPLAAYFDHSLMWQDLPDRIAQSIVDVFISGKFITIFSFLFGLGFAVMMDRAEARGVTKRRFYLRRLAVLLVFGLVHAILFWYGDILAAYALMGFVLFLFRRSSQRKVLIWGFLFYSWPLFVAALMTGLAQAGIPMPPPEGSSPEKLAAAIRAYSSGTYAELFQERMKENAFMLFAIFFFYPRCLGLFLFGLWTWRKGIISNLDGHTDLLRKCCFWGLTIGLPLNLASTLLNEIYHPNPLGYSPLVLLVNVLSSAGVPFMSLFYMCGLALVARDPFWRARLQPFGAVGRTALSNYLLQTLICTTFYYSYGLGVYGKVGPLLGLVPTFIIYGALLLLSNWWIHRFAYGPVEWLWRSLTYMRAPAFRLQPVPETKEPGQISTGSGG